MASLDQPVENLSDFRGKDIVHDQPQKRALPARVHHLAEGTIGQHDATIGIERSDPVRDRLQHRLKLTPAGLQCGVGSAQLDGGVLHGATAALEIGGHMVEAAHQLAKFLRCALSHPMRVVPGGDRLHCVSQRFYGLRHLLREM